MKKIVQKTVLLLVVFGGVEQGVFALNSGAQNLSNTVGATDYFKITCAKSDNGAVGDTDHLNFKLIENNAGDGTSPTTTTVPPQVLNATLTKLKLSATASSIMAETSKDVILKGGNGAYTLSLDTFGTNLTLKTAQTYTIQYQCLNTAGKATVGTSTLAKSGVASISKTLANGKTAKYAINCAKDKTNGNTDTLKVTVTNKTAAIKNTATVAPVMSTSTGNLTAQVIKGGTALNTIGDVLDVQVGNGDYAVMVNSPVSKAQTYSFQYSCLNKNNVETKTSPFQILQNQ